jgi:hypothetical protein
MYYMFGLFSSARCVFLLRGSSHTSPLPSLLGSEGAINLWIPTLAGLIHHQVCL